MSVIISYKTINQFIVQRQYDGAFIPTESDNTDYQEYLKWIAAGNTPTSED